MIFSDTATYYDILDITPDASPQEVREAYIRTKATFTRDSLALYTLITPEEREEVLQKIEEAYLVLSDQEKRKQYDQNHGLLTSIENPFAGKDEKPLPQNVISIDRVPPMESVPEGDQILIPPTTDFSSSQSKIHDADSQPNLEPKSEDQNQSHPAHSNETSSQSIITKKSNLKSSSIAPPPRAPSHPINRSRFPELDPSLVQAIELETEWRGSFLKKVREAYRISLEEMSGVTKVTKSYLTALEEENYGKLPAPVYIRGFVIQMAKILRLPPEKVATAYLNRYYRVRTQT